MEWEGGRLLFGRHWVAKGGVGRRCLLFVVGCLAGVSANSANVDAPYTENPAPGRTWAHFGATFVFAARAPGRTWAHCGAAARCDWALLGASAGDGEKAAKREGAKGGTRGWSIAVRHGRIGAGPSILLG